MTAINLPAESDTTVLSWGAEFLPEAISAESSSADAFRRSTWDVAVTGDLRRPVWRDRAEVLADLDEVCHEASTHDWDGDGAVPVTGDTCAMARRLIEALPTELPDPSIVAKPSGWLGLTWSSSPDSVFSVSVRHGDALAFAGLFNGARNYGTEAFVGAFPDICVELARRALAPAGA